MVTEERPGLVVCQHRGIRGAFRMTAVDGKKRRIQLYDCKKVKAEVTFLECRLCPHGPRNSR